MKNGWKKIKLLLILTAILCISGAVKPVQAASAWSFSADTGKKIKLNGLLVLEKNEYRNIDIYKNGKNIKEKDSTYMIEWSSSDPDVVWIDVKNGRLRADKFGRMEETEAEVEITAHITNKKTGAVTEKGFVIRVESAEKQPEPTAVEGPDMSVYPEWFSLPDATVKDRETPVLAPAKGVTLSDLTIFGTDELYFGEDGYLYAEGKREDGSIGRVPLHYTVADPSVLSVSANGIITTLKPGTTKVTIRLGDEPKQFSYRFTVTPSHYNAVKGQTEGVGKEALKVAQVVLDFIEKNIQPKMSDYEKIKLVHDYIIRNTEYKNRGDERDHMVFGPLLDGYAVCEGYAKAFDLFMYALDIDCIMVSGEAGEPHAWNIVQVDGVPYHLDATWDDPVSAQKDPEEVSYEYFLLPEAYITKTHSYILSDYPYCKDTYYTYYYYRDNIIASVRDFEDKFKELYAVNPDEVIILYPEKQMVDKEAVFRQNGGKGFKWFYDKDGELPRLGEYTILRIRH